MELNNVFHRTTDNYCYMLDENRLVVNLKTGFDINEVYIHHSDPFATGILGSNSDWSGNRDQIPFKKELDNGIWWTTTLTPEFKRQRYFFELVGENEKNYLFEDGIVAGNELEQKMWMHQCFTFPWMNPADICRTPKWVNDTVWYQIFPERFCNGDTSNDPDGVLPWKEEGCVNNQEFYGGDIRGIISKLDYLQELGITGIYLTPVNMSPSCHKYDTTDYTVIDPHFGDDKVFKEMVDEAHRRGIRVMLDAVFNHCGAEFPMWKDVVEKGESSEYADWFMINKWPVQPGTGAAKRGEYYSFAFNDKMPKLDTNNPKVRQYLTEVCTGWVEKYDVDGIRLDVANEISHVFCRELRQKLKNIKPDIYILGEIWHDSMQWLRGDEFDAVMNYPLGQTIKNFWFDKGMSSKKFEHAINWCYTRYMQQTNDVLFNLVDSHDTERIANQFKDKRDIYGILSLLFSMPGTACIYYGTEIALEGGPDPDNRRCMPWNKIESGVYSETLGFVKKLISLRKSEELLKGRNFHFCPVEGKPRVLHFAKLGWIDNFIDIIVNGSDEKVTIEDEGEILMSFNADKNAVGEKGILFRRIVGKTPDAVSVK